MGGMYPSSSLALLPSLPMGSILNILFFINYRNLLLLLIVFRESEIEIIRKQKQYTIKKDEGCNFELLVNYNFHV